MAKKNDQKDKFWLKKLQLSTSKKIDTNGPNFPKRNLGLEIQKTNVGIRTKTNNFDFLGHKLPENRFWGRHFKNLSPDSESAPPRNHVYQF